MEQKKVDHYSAGYEAPAPVEIGRWYESLSPEEMKQFRADMAEISRRPYVYRMDHENREEEDSLYGDIFLIFYRHDDKGEKDGKEKD